MTTEEGLLPNTRYVFMLKANDGWAVGYRAMHWDGETWNNVRTSTTDFYSIFMVSSRASSNFSVLSI